MSWKAQLLEMLGLRSSRSIRARERLAALRLQTRLRGTPVPARPRRFRPHPG